MWVLACLALTGSSQRDTNERIKKGKFEAWAARTKVPIVIGPAKSQDEYSTTSVFDDVGAEFWVVDHHHRVLGYVGGGSLLARAMNEMQWNGGALTIHCLHACSVYRSDMAWNKKNLLCEVVQNYSHLTKHDFYRTIVNQQLVWLADQKGLYPLDPTLLPETFGHMHPDPYRDLAAYVRSRKGFHATSVLYAEFHWANYFRAVLPWPTHPREERFTEWCKIRPYSSECTENGITEAQWIENVLPTALQMAHSPQASQLPGYIGSAQ